MVEKTIIRPKRRVPGKHQYDDADINADDDIEVELHPAKPKGNSRGPLGCGLPFLHGRTAWRTGRKQVRLLRHFPLARARRGSTPGWSIATVTQQPQTQSQTESGPDSPAEHWTREGCPPQPAPACRGVSLLRPGILL